MDSWNIFLFLTAQDLIGDTAYIVGGELYSIGSSCPTPEIKRCYSEK
jgi:hypothetical protein